MKYAFAFAIFAIGACHYFEGPLVKPESCPVPCPGGLCCEHGYECAPEGRCRMVDTEFLVIGKARDAGK
jgi:hypothetical protein